MIRMGRNSRPEPETSNAQTPPTADAYRYSAEPQTASNRAISESDSMARDIKEGRLSGFVGHGTTLTGETQFQAMLRVDGHLIGTVSSETGTLIIGTNGKVEANILVAAAIINGSVHGDIIATEKLQLGRTARVLGNIQSPRLVVEEGAILEGTCSMLKAREIQEEESVAAVKNKYDESLSQADQETADLFADSDEEGSAETATA